MYRNRASIKCNDFRLFICIRACVVCVVISGVSSHILALPAVHMHMNSHNTRCPHVNAPYSVTFAQMPPSNPPQSFQFGLK